MILSGSTPKPRTLLISPFEAQSKLVPNALRVSRTVSPSLHFTAEKKNYLVPSRLTFNFKIFYAIYSYILPLLFFNVPVH